MKAVITRASARTLDKKSVFTLSGHVVEGQYKGGDFTIFHHAYQETAAQAQATEIFARKCADAGVEDRFWGHNDLNLVCDVSCTLEDVDGVPMKKWDLLGKAVADTGAMGLLAAARARAAAATPTATPTPAPATPTA